MSFFLFCFTSHNAQLNKVGLALPSGLWVDIELDISSLSDEQPFIFVFLKFYDDIMTSVRCSGDPGPDLGPGPRLPAEVEAEVPPGPGPSPALSLQAPDTQAEVSGH